MDCGKSLEDRIKQLQDQSYFCLLSPQDSLHAIAADGHEVWNAWFERTPPQTTLDFKSFDFNQAPIDFSDFIFRAPEDGSACVDFSNVNLQGANNFARTIFETRALFFRSSLGRDSRFDESVFRSTANFRGATFGSEANFSKANFLDDADFTDTGFENNAVFTSIDFKGKSDFSGGKFGNNTDFSDACFTLEAEFFGRKFGHQTKFNTSIFNAHANFKGATFGLSCAFTHTDFRCDVDFSQTTFSSGADFSHVQFGLHAEFEEAQLKDSASFQFSSFKGPVSFVKSKFGDKTDFRTSTFHANADFQGASFGDGLDFGTATFRAGCMFQATEYGNCAGFEQTVFFGDADFSASIRGSTTDSSHFQSVSFASARFNGDVNFEGRKFKSTTRFGRAATPLEKQVDAAVFRGIPMFHGCELHQDTDLREAIFQEDFPACRGGDAARAYRTLKLAMEKLKATREEQRFFRLEMKAEHPSLSRGKRWISTLYSILSDYGFSLWRPIIALLIFSTLFGIGYGLLANACTSNQECIQTAITAKITSSADRTSDLLKYTLASVAPVPGLDKMQTELRAPLFGQHGWIAVTAVVLEIFHKIVALVMTFLFALALRNLFKMKS